MHVITETSVFRFIASLLVAVSLVLTPVLSAQVGMDAGGTAVAQETGHSDGMPCHMNASTKTSQKPCCTDNICQNCQLCNTCMTATHTPVLLENIPVLFKNSHPVFPSLHPDRYISLSLSPDLQPPIV
jgi:hypothetical protein